MTSSAARRALTTVAAAVALVVAGLPAAADVTSPDDLPEPTPDQLARSVQVFDPAGSVRVWSVDGDVRGLVAETIDGGESVITLTSDLLFAFGSADLEPATVAAIGAEVAGLPQGVAVSVTGHTDSVGDDSINLPLSEARAQAVAATITATRPDLVLTVEGLGSSRPVAENTVGGEDNPAGRALNRRVEIRYAG